MRRANGSHACNFNFPRSYVKKKKEMGKVNFENIFYLTHRIQRGVTAPAGTQSGHRGLLMRHFILFCLQSLECRVCFTLQHISAWTSHVSGAHWAHVASAPVLGSAGLGTGSPSPAAENRCHLQKPTGSHWKESFSAWGRRPVLWVLLFSLTALLDPLRLLALLWFLFTKHKMGLFVFDSVRSIKG